MNALIVTVITGLTALTTSLPLIAHEEPKRSIPHIIKGDEENIDLSSYFDQLLSQIGFNNATQAYLLDLSRTQLQNIPEYDVPERTRQLRRNLAIFLQNITGRVNSPTKIGLAQEVFWTAQASPEPWDSVLSDRSLDLMRKNHIYTNLTTADIDALFKKVCPIWPFYRH